MSASASFMVRDDRYKLIYYVGMPRQLFDDTLVRTPIIGEAAQMRNDEV